MKENIAYSDFAKLDLRAGTIVEIIAVPKSKKLIQLQVDFGSEIGVRTILAGLAKDHAEGRVDPGMKVMAVINLEPREMMGIMSYGMLLASADESERVWLVNPGPIPNGMEVG